MTFWCVTSKVSCLWFWYSWRTFIIYDVEAFISEIFFLYIWIYLFTVTTYTTSRLKIERSLTGHRMYYLVSFSNFYLILLRHKGKIAIWISEPLHLLSNKEFNKSQCRDILLSYLWRMLCSEVFCIKLKIHNF